MSPIPLRYTTNTLITVNIFSANTLIVVNIKLNPLKENLGMLVENQIVNELDARFFSQKGTERSGHNTEI